MNEAREAAFEEYKECLKLIGMSANSDIYAWYMSWKAAEKKVADDLEDSIGNIEFDLVAYIKQLREGQ